MIRARLALVLPALLAAAPALAQFDPRGTTVEHCAPCHGQEGIAPDSEVPHLAGQNERYLYNQLMAFRSGRRPHREMRFMARELTPKDMEALAAYYASLPPR
ncbi:MAG: c-type cytochrome [Beijerinckiaceae bacterium]